MQVSMLSGEMMTHLLMTLLSVRQTKAGEQHLRPLQAGRNPHDSFLCSSRLHRRRLEASQAVQYLPPGDSFPLTDACHSASEAFCLV